MVPGPVLPGQIVEVARRSGRIAGCNTAEKGIIPKVFAAIIRVISVVRTIVAVEEGAVGRTRTVAKRGPT